jgi:alkanesulfonate monooxygenase SsuD/methylene tetrahydromethanopterin reductase-like flavin-dependent oxidoreductase (luciferase family)
MRFGLYVSNIGSFSDPRTVLDLSVRAEAAGWESLFIWDHLAWVWDGPSVDPWVTLAAVASRTERLLVGAGVTPVPRRRPHVLANQAATLDDLSGGRVVLGVGIGGNRKEFEEFGESFDHAERWRLLEGGIATMRELWAGPLGPREIPVWVGGNSPRSRRLARTCEGWFPDTTSTSEMTMAPEDIAGQSMSDIAVMGYSSPGDTEVRSRYADAGATWWLESLHDRRMPLDATLARVEAGP